MPKRDLDAIPQTNAVARFADVARRRLATQAEGRRV
jgi:hypothetical protein